MLFRSDWWTEESAKRFLERSGAIVKQFAAYAAIDELKLNGELTQGENIADLGGLKIAYAAFKKATAAAFYRLLRRWTNVEIPVDTGDFRLMGPRAVRAFRSLRERHRFIRGMTAWVGFRQRGIEVPRGTRYDQRPRVSLGGLWRLAKTAIYSFSSFPLRVFHQIGRAHV